MRLDITPEKSMKIRIVWNGSVVKEDDVEAGKEYKLALELPKTFSSTVKVVGVHEDGTEVDLGSETYTMPDSGDPNADENGGCGRNCDDSGEPTRGGCAGDGKGGDENGCVPGSEEESQVP